jgi:hypothetical protein
MSAASSHVRIHNIRIHSKALLLLCEYIAPSLLSWALVSFTRGERVSVTLWIRNWLGLWADLEAVEQKDLLPLPVIAPRLSSP